MRISDWSSDVCSSELFHAPARGAEARGAGHRVDEPEEQEVIMAETQTLSDLKDLGQAADAVTEAPIREQELDQHGRAYGTGRRKDAIARVWIKPGTGKIVVDRKSVVSGKGV